MKPVLLALALLFFAVAANASASEVDYAVSPVIDNGSLIALQVVARLRADPSGTTTLQLPDWDRGVSDLWKYVQDLTIDGAAAVKEDGPARRVVTSAPGAPLTIRYRVVSAFDHDPTARDQDTYKPTLRPRWFWIYGEALFVYPDQGRYVARFAWTAAPQDYPFASNLEHPAGRPMSIDDLTQSVLIGGPDLRITRRVVDGAPIRVAVVGRFSFVDDDFADLAARIIRGERQFWRGREGPFLVALAALGDSPHSLSIGGEGRGDAFAVQMTRNAGIERIKFLLGHEYFHTWNPPRLGGIDSGDQEPAGYWFSEGFTDFYARKLLLRMGVYSLEDFVAAWNEALREYADSPVRTAPNSRVVTDFWRSHDVHDLPYMRGSIMAARWDHELRERSGRRVGLDDVMRAMRDAAETQGAKGSKAPELFVATARRLGLDVEPDVAAVIDAGAPALLPDGAFGDCVKVVTTTMPQGGGVTTLQQLELPASLDPAQRTACAAEASA